MNRDQSLTYDVFDVLDRNLSTDRNGNPVNTQISSTVLRMAFGIRVREFRKPCRLIRRDRVKGVLAFVVARFNLDNDERIIVKRYDVDLAMPRPEIRVDDLVAFFLKKIARDLLSARARSNV